LRECNCTCPFEDHLTWPVPLNRRRLRCLGTQLPEGARIAPGRPLDAFAVGPLAENYALAWLRRAAAARDRVRPHTHNAVQIVALRAVAGALWTSYDASFPAIWVEAMKRRSRAGGEPAKARPRKALKRKGGSAPKAVSLGRSSLGQTEVARLTRENARLLSELSENQHQKTAIGEVLTIISHSTFDLEKVLNMVLELAARLSEADKGVILRASGNRSYHAAASYQHAPEFMESQKGMLFAPGRSGVVGRVLLDGKSVQIPDIFNDPEFAYRKLAKRGGFRTILGVPLLREGTPIGILVLHRADVRPFTEKQIKLVETFAAQAVIAIENARLLNELRQRTADLTASLEQQTATSDVLQVISSFPGDLQPVFDAMLEKAARICDATFGRIYRWDGDALHLVGTHNTPPAFAEAARRRSPIRPIREGLSVVCWRQKRRYTSRTLRLSRCTLKNATRHSLRPSNSEVYARFWTCRC